MTFAAAERAQLAQLFHRVGPDAPTLCEGWSTRDLAAHLYVRENKFPISIEIWAPFSWRLDDAMDAQCTRDFDELVDDWAAGPSKRSPRYYLDGVMNTAEHFIHHEDVRRGRGEVTPREFSRVVEADLMKAARMMGQMALSSSEVPVVLTPQNHPPVTLGGKRGVVAKGDRVVRVSGDPGELLLWVTGRDAVQVDIDGAQADIAKVKRRI